MRTGILLKREAIAPYLSNSVNRDESACIHNQDNPDFMNKSKSERYMLRCTSDVVSMSWDLSDESGSRVVEQIVEDNDQGPSKEWGP